MSVSVRPVPVTDILPLRHEVLRAGLPFESAKFAHDEDEGSVHFAAFEDDSIKVIGCCTLVRQPYDEVAAWQLRGMAVAPAARKLGVGRRLLEAAETHIRTTSYSRIWWCNARIVAVPFYQRMGWQIVSPLFDIPAAGPHHRMLRLLD